MSLKIKVYDGMRDKLYKTPLQKIYGMIPPGLTTVIGTTGSGKTNIICNILNNSLMLKNYFDKIYLFCLSPADTLKANCDLTDIYMDDDPERIVAILEEQDNTIKEKGFEKADHVLIILDDIVQSNTFLKHEILNKIAFSGTWSKVSTIITSQSYVQIPRRIRLNAHAVLLFHGLTETELDRFCDEHASPYLNKRAFRDMIKYALNEPYSFLFYNRTNPNKKQAYRQGFETILKIK